MYDILFLCAANVGRSQMAEGFYNHYRQGNYAISAAGIKDVREAYQGKPHPEVIAAMRERMIDISHQVIKIILPELVNQASRVVIFFEPDKSPPQLQEYLRNHPSVEYMVVEDPCPGKPKDIAPEEFARNIRVVRDKIDDVIKKILKSNKR